MEQPTPTAPQDHKLAASQPTLFGAPIGDLGWFASLLMGTATGFAAFFFVTFLGIVGILVLNTTTHRNIDFAWSYTRLGLPVGVVVLVAALGYLGSLWVRRQFRRS